MRRLMRLLLKLGFIAVVGLVLMSAVRQQGTDAVIKPPPLADKTPSQPPQVRSKVQAISSDADVFGQFRIEGKANGAEFRFLVDTGASDIVFRKDDAKRLGLNVNRLVFDGRSWTANGVVRTASARIKRLTIGPFSSDDVLVSFNEGELAEPLLGMAFLRGINVSISNGKLTLSGQPK
jgi:clan AA aspartic protease (TIGR02281 family)